MFGSGRGEILEPFDIDLSGYDLRVEIPSDASGRPVAVSTREAYSGIVPREQRGLTGDGGKGPALLSRSGEAARMDVAGPLVTADTDAIPLREALKLPVDQWRGIVVNDFEATVCPKHPEIPALIEDFYRRGAVYAAMSGSGSSVFGIWPKNI